MRGDLIDRTKKFAVDVIRFSEGLPRGRTTEIIARQLIRAASSVGANYRAACRARSRADFVSKITIVEEESDEVMYWLELLRDLGYVRKESVDNLVNESSELTAIFVSSAKTARRNS